MSLSEHITSSKTWKDVDIVLKYKKYPEFKKQLDKIQKEYLESLNMSIYSSLEYLQKFGVFQLIPSKTNSTKTSFYLNFYAFKVEFSEDEEDKLYLLFIRMLDQKLRQNKEMKYSIIYFHCLSQSTFAFSFINETFKKLPIFYYAMLDKIYVVQPNFLVKNTIGMFDFGRLHKLFTKRIIYVQNLYQLQKIEEISKNKVLEQIPQVLKQHKSIKDQKKTNKNGALQNIENKGGIKHQLVRTNSVRQQKFDMFTIPLESHKLSPQGIPIILLILLETLKSHPQFLNLEGIFRKNGSIEEQEEIMMELSTMNSTGTLKNATNYSGYAIAGVTKKFFNNLLTPLIPYNIYQQIIEAIDIQQGQQVQFVKSTINKMPLLNKKILTHLIIFLKQQVISRKDTNKMNHYNISVCFNPCLFRAQKISYADFFASQKFAKVLQIIITNFEQIFPKQQIKLFFGKQNRGSKGSRGSRNSKENSKQNNKEDSPTKILI